MKRLFLFVGLGLLLVVSLAFYFLSVNKSSHKTVSNSSKLSPQITKVPSIQPKALDLITFDSTSSGFSLKYPGDFKHVTTSDGERFYKLGPTQKDIEELLDGINVTIRSGKLGSTIFKTWVDKRYKEIGNSSTKPTLGGKIPITIASIQGIAFTVEDPSEKIMIFLPKGNKEYLEITNFTVDPNKKDQTYQKIVDSILSTIKIH